MKAAARLLNTLRWKYVAPRAAIVLLVVLTLRFALDGALRWAIVAGGEAALGAKVEVGDLTTRLLDGHLIVSDVAAANPQKPMRNLVNANEVRLAVDAGQLLHKRLVIRNGLVSGLQFDTIRVTSGALSDDGDDSQQSGESMFDPLVEAAQQRADQWLDDLAGRLEGDLTAKLQTPRVVEALETRWPEQYESLKSRAEKVRANGKQIEQDFRDVRKNPLRHLDQLQQLQQRVAATQAELQALHVDVTRLPEQAETDRQALQAARKHDEQFLRDQLSADALDGDQLSRFLLGEEAGQRLSTAIRWLKLARRLAPGKKVKIDKSARHRGVDVLFVDRPLPKWHVQQVKLEGQASIGGAPLKLEGALTNASSAPHLLQQPLRVALVGSGGVDCKLIVEADRCDGQERDSLALECPALPLPGRTLGKADRFALAVQPSQARLNARVRLVGDELSGAVVLSQPAVSIAASIPAIRDPQLSESMSRAFASLERFDARLELSGTLDQPQWRLQSDLGQQLADGFNAAVKNYLNERAKQVLAKMQAKVDEQVVKLDAKRIEAQEELLAKLGGDQQLLAELTSLAGGGRPGASTIDIPQLGEALKSSIRKR